MRDLLRARVAIARRTALQDIGDVDLLALQPDGGQHAVQQLPGAADEGLTRAVLVRPRGLADQHQACLAVADPEDGLGAGLAQAAGAAAGHGRGQGLPIQVPESASRAGGVGAGARDPAAVGSQGSSGAGSQSAPKRPRVSVQFGGGSGGRSDSATISGSGSTFAVSHAAGGVALKGDATRGIQRSMPMACR